MYIVIIDGVTIKLVNTAIIMMYINTQSCTVVHALSVFLIEQSINSQVVFNCIDYGEYFDYAVVALCTSLSLPYITGSSFGHTAIAECYPSLAVPQKGETRQYQCVVMVDNLLFL